MKVIKPGHKARRTEILPVWLKIAREVSSGTPIKEVAAQFANPKTGKAYSRAAIYYILKQLEVSA